MLAYCSKPQGPNMAMTVWSVQGRSKLGGLPTACGSTPGKRPGGPTRTIHIAPRRERVVRPEQGTRSGLLPNAALAIDQCLHATNHLIQSGQVLSKRGRQVSIP